jgi:hypothetical protein
MNLNVWLGNLLLDYSIYSVFTFGFVGILQCY